LPKLAGMTRDDASDLRLRPGRIRDRGRASAPRARSFVDQVMRAAAKANGGPLTPEQMRGQARRRGGSAGKGRCSRIGRGQRVADALKRAAAERSGPRQRRVVVKARIVRHKLGSGAQGAHLRYLERDGITRDGARGQLYGPDTDRADRAAFVERGAEDRHSFRFIVAPEDGDRIGDLRAFTRDVMQQMEGDLGTKLDWVAVDHFNTGHPHSHVVIRGKDDTGKDLIIAQDYITDGVRLRAQERVTLELGPETDLELRQKLQAEITADRFTRIDRAMLEEAPDRVLDMRPDAGQVRADFDRTLRIGRLQTLARLNLATEGQPGVWVLSEKLEPTLRELGERVDIIKTMNRALTRRGQERDPMTYRLHGTAPAEPVVGRVIGQGLTDELGDRIGLVIDGTDGRVHHIEIGDVEALKDVRIGSIVEAGPRAAGRPADRTIAALARDTGEYRPSEHRAMIESGDVRLPPGADADAFVDSHVRRLEALRRAGIVERHGPDRWGIPPDFESRAAAYKASRSRQANLRVLTTFDLERQITSDGATWLDRTMLKADHAMLADSGFGREVQAAWDARKEELVRQGHAWRTPEGGIKGRRDLLAALERQEVERVGKTLAAERGVPFARAEAGETVQGKFTGTVQLASGKFAVVENPFEMQLVPWRPVIDQYLGREVSGLARAGGGASSRRARLSEGVRPRARGRRHRVDDRPLAGARTLSSA
jgi:type IV secretory pathway VirD2 relaxase